MVSNACVATPPDRRRHPSGQGCKCGVFDLDEPSGIVTKGHHIEGRAGWPTYERGEKCSEPPIDEAERRRGCPSRHSLQTLIMIGLGSVALTWAIFALYAQPALASRRPSGVGNSKVPIQQYTVKTAWPTGAFDQYHVKPNGTSVLPQPAIYDASTGGRFPLELTQSYPLPEVRARLWALWSACR